MKSLPSRSIGEVTVTETVNNSEHHLILWDNAWKIIYNFQGYQAYFSWTCNKLVYKHWILSCSQCCLHGKEPLIESGTGWIPHDPPEILQQNLTSKIEQ